MAKILANKLKPLLNSIISTLQGAFVVNRSIGENMGLAHEVFPKIKKIPKNKKGWHALKIDMADMAKAYDRMEWLCVFATIQKLGFW